MVSRLGVKFCELAEKIAEHLLTVEDERRCVLVKSRLSCGVNVFTAYDGVDRTGKDVDCLLGAYQGYGET